MKNTWKKIQLGDLLELHYGKGLPKRDRKSGNVPVYGSNGVAGWHSEHLIEGPAIIVGRKGSIGEIHWSDTPSYPIDTTFYIESTDNYDLRFIYYLLKNSNLTELNSDAAIPGLNRNMAYSQSCYVPNLQTQNKISTILSNYDLLIANNNRRIKILEEISQRLYEEWFINFKFPGHEKVKMVDSELGEIPEGWSFTNVNTVTKIITRGIQPKYKDDSQCRVINQRCIRDHKIDLKLARGNDTKKRPVLNKERYVRLGDVLVNSTGVGTLGRLAQVNQNLENYIVDSHVTIVRPNNLIDIDYFGAALLSMEKQIERMGKGATGQTELSRDSIGNIILLLPNMKIQRKFSEVVSPINKLIINLMKKNEILSQTRDLLLPKLILGEIEV